MCALIFPIAADTSTTQPGMLRKASIKVSWMNFRVLVCLLFFKKKGNLYSGLKKRGRNGGGEINRQQTRRKSLAAGRQQKDTSFSDAVFRVYLWVWVRRAAHLCLFVCMNNSGPWRGQPAAVMRGTCIDSKYCWWGAIDLTTICPNFSQEAERFVQPFTQWLTERGDRWTSREAQSCGLRVDKKGKWKKRL